MSSWRLADWLPYWLADWLGSSAFACYRVVARRGRPLEFGDGWRVFVGSGHSSALVYH